MSIEKEKNSQTESKSGLNVSSNTLGSGSAGNLNSTLRESTKA